MYSSSSDINECVQQSHNCGVDYDCVNTEGSFRCDPKPRCPVGFDRDAQGNCIGEANHFLTGTCVLQHGCFQFCARAGGQQGDFTPFYSIIHIFYGFNCTVSGNELIKCLFGLKNVIQNEYVSLYEGQIIILKRIYSLSYCCSQEKGPS